MADGDHFSWKRIVESIMIWVFATIICGILFTAGNIVWTAASSWQHDLNTTKEELQVVIGNLSTKLASYEGQFINQSNQMERLNQALIDMNEHIEKHTLVGPLPKPLSTNLPAEEIVFIPFDSYVPQGTSLPPQQQQISDAAYKKIMTKEMEDSLRSRKK